MDDGEVGKDDTSYRCRAGRRARRARLRPGNNLGVRRSSSHPDIGSGFMQQLAGGLPCRATGADLRTVIRPGAGSGKRPTSFPAPGMTRRHSAPPSSGTPCSPLCLFAAACVTGILVTGCGASRFRYLGQLLFPPGATFFSRSRSSSRATENRTLPMALPAFFDSATPGRGGVMAGWRSTLRPVCRRLASGLGGAVEG